MTVYFYLLYMFKHILAYRYMKEILKSLINQRPYTPQIHHITALLNYWCSLTMNIALRKLRSCSKNNLNLNIDLHCTIIGICLSLEWWWSSFGIFSLPDRNMSVCLGMFQILLRVKKGRKMNSGFILIYQRYQDSAVQDTGTCFIHGPPLLIKQGFISKSGPCMKQMPVVQEYKEYKKSIFSNNTKKFWDMKNHQS